MNDSDLMYFNSITAIIYNENPAFYFLFANGIIVVRLKSNRWFETSACYYILKIFPQSANCNRSLVMFLFIRPDKILNKRRNN